MRKTKIKGKKRVTYLKIQTRSEISVQPGEVDVVLNGLMNEMVNEQYFFPLF